MISLCDREALRRIRSDSGEGRITRESWPKRGESVSDRVLRFPDRTWDELEGLPQPLRNAAHRAIFHLNHLLPARLGSPHCPADMGVYEQTSECRWEYRRPSARCTIGSGLRPLRLAVPRLRLAVTRRWLSTPRELFGQDGETCGMYRWLRDKGFLEGLKILCLSCNDSNSTGEQFRLALQGSPSNEKGLNDEE